jgi:cellulose synthase/poly-beta-1,6-N-acetylglucosamine synthase-like glycosyltransferase
LFILEIAYTISVLLLAVYGFNALILAGIRKWYYTPLQLIDSPKNYNWPDVTVQLPVYNERYVVRRLIDAVGSFDYPHERLHIQVLDDSTDITTQIIADVVATLSAQGIDIVHIQRPNRDGYKGGALQYGLNFVAGDIIAIFDADFVPPKNFLKRTLPYFDRDSQIGCLQTRWGHINRESSWLTRTQASGIDGHFIIEQETRSESKAFLNFNGTAGVWRKSCIEDAGGWHHDTLTEDLDLSYRAQLHGWRIRYLPHIITPAELPVHINAFKRQQYRWAKGSIQTARKLLVDLWYSSQPLMVKVEGTIHLTHYAVHPLMLVNLLLMLPLIHSDSFLIGAFPYLTMAAIGPVFMYTLALSGSNKPIFERLLTLLMLILLGMGVSLNNSRAVVAALWGSDQTFLRTPKFNIKDGDVKVKSNAYLLRRDFTLWLELLLGIFSLGMLIYALLNGQWELIVWLALYTVGFLYVAGLNILQSGPGNHIKGLKWDRLKIQRFGKLASLRSQIYHKASIIQTSKE